MAVTQTTQTTVEPVAYDCVKIVVVRSGAAVVCSEFGTRRAKVGDVAVLAANTLCGAEPEDWFTTTTLYLDRDYVIDQVFWQYAQLFTDRWDAKQYLETRYAEPAQLVHLGEDHASQLMPWLDELTSLSVGGLAPERFYRAQSLLFAIFDVIVPRLNTTERRATFTQRPTARPTLPKHRQLRALRVEAREVALLLRGELDRRWTLRELAESVHLSPSQLGRVFVSSFGRSPIAYLTMLRAERMVHLLRVTDLPISVIASQVGWSDGDFAARQFRRSVGVTPSRYRAMGRHGVPRETTGRSAHPSG